MAHRRVRRWGLHRPAVQQPTLVRTSPSGHVGGNFGACWADASRRVRHGGVIGWAGWLGWACLLYRMATSPELLTRTCAIVGAGPSPRRFASAPLSRRRWRHSLASLTAGTPPLPTLWARGTVILGFMLEHLGYAGVAPRSRISGRDLSRCDPTRAGLKVARLVPSWAEPWGHDVGRGLVPRRSLRPAPQDPPPAPAPPPSPSSWSPRRSSRPACPAAETPPSADRAACCGPRCRPAWPCPPGWLRPRVSAGPGVGAGFHARPVGMT